MPLNKKNKYAKFLVYERKIDGITSYIMRKLRIIDFKLSYEESYTQLCLLIQRKKMICLFFFIFLLTGLKEENQWVYFPSSKDLYCYLVIATNSKFGIPDFELVAI